MDRTLDNRKYVIAAFIVVIVLIFLIKLFFIQIIDTRYKVSAENNSQRHVTQYPARGLIYERNNNLLVYNQAAYDLMIVPREVKAFDTLDLCKILKMPVDRVVKSISKAKRHSWYKPSIFLKQMSAITYAHLQEKLFKFPGFFVQTRTLRKYPQNIAANVLGYVGEVGERLTKKNNYYEPGDYTGISGIEKTYERSLRGKKGVTIYLVDVHNRIQGSFQEGKYDTVAISGSDIITTIDAQLQAYGEKLMSNKIGSITAIQPSTGEILCLVSSPGYDPNLLVGRIRGKNYNILKQDTLKPLFNRALMAQYPPGSTFKIVNALVGLQENVVDLSTKYSCSGPDSKPIRCSHYHVSPIGLVSSIEQSCNSYYWKVFKSIIKNPLYENAEQGFEIWRNHILSFGFGSPVGFDLFT
ncbi:MAG: penicillin-binding transpeptidase domain-containing protein, partial [Bacteroidota bacterium]|nr:penicillin-binding transpeptidase domain-containing protein [Bacteroidota bacterium]